MGKFISGDETSGSFRYSLKIVMYLFLCVVVDSQFCVSILWNILLILLFLYLLILQTGDTITSDDTKKRLNYNVIVSIKILFLSNFW